MKTTLLFLPILLLFLAFEPSPAATDTLPEAIRDTAGNSLRSTFKYYILPVFRGRGGGLTLASNNRNGTCPLDVVQERHDVSKGLPLTFTPVAPTKGIVRVSTDLNIKFSAATTCAQSTVWKIQSLGESTGQWVVTTGGVEGNPGKDTTSNWFKVEKYEDDYKLVFCPTVCNFCKVICRDVGIETENGTRRLVLNYEPLKVVFKKV